MNYIASEKILTTAGLLNGSLVNGNNHFVRVTVSYLSIMLSNDSSAGFFTRRVTKLSLDAYAYLIHLLAAFLCLKLGETPHFWFLACQLRNILYISQILSAAHSSAMTGLVLSFTILMSFSILFLKF